ncbi:MAG: response regulator [Chthoniobacteraceae bacterium]
MRKIDLKSQLGTAIRTKRNDLGISQEELADRAGLHRTYISDIERGARNLSLESIDKLATALQISIASLFFNADNPSHLPRNTASPADSVDIVLVEDDENDAELALHAFKEARLSNRIRHIHDGAEALDYVFCRNRYAGRYIDNRPQVILLDLNLPKVSGIEVLRQIKADDRTKSIHVIVLTVSQEDGDIAQCRKLGADTYIVKPVSFNNLSEVTAHLKLYWALLKKPSSIAA